MRHFYLNNFFFLSLCLCLAQQMAWGQSQWPAFCVYEVHGNVVVQKLPGAKVTQIKKHQFIFKEDVIILKDDPAELILFDQDTNYITINKKGSYTTSIIQNYKKDHLKGTVVIKYFSLFWEDFFKPIKPAGISDKEKISNSSGGVRRGIELLISPGTDLRTSMDECLFKWQKIEIATSYTLLISGNDGKADYQRKTQDTQLLVRFRDSLVYGQNYKWAIYYNENKTSADEGSIQLVDEQKVLAGLPDKVGDSLNGIAHELELADLYEKNGCIKKAYGIYQALVKQFPLDPSLKELYQDFLKNNYIVQENLYR